MKDRRARSLRIGLLTLSAAAACPAQVQWLQRSSPGPVQTNPYNGANAAGAFDTARGRFVLFGRALDTGAPQTWEWDGAQWFECHPATQPPELAWSEMIYDPVHGRCLLAGNRSAPLTNVQLWQWDGTNWQVHSSIPNTAAALAYDGTAGRPVVLKS